MKTVLVVFSFLGVALTAAAYQAGPQNRTNFGGAQATQAGQGQYRSFSNYNNRSWGQGVQTQTVQTQVAGSSAVDFEKDTPQKPVGKAQAPAPKAAPAVKPVVPAQPTAPAAAQMPANADPAAMLQQVQGMMNAMSGMTGGAQAGQPGAQGQAGQMPAGMPDISALMGGAMPAVPAATPAKK